jgi:hypothetical protein
MGKDLPLPSEDGRWGWGGLGHEAWGPRGGVSREEQERVLGMQRNSKFNWRPAQVFFSVQGTLHLPDYVKIT